MTDPKPELAVQPSWGKRLIGIEGLRGAAAISVLVHHTSKHLSTESAIGAIGWDLADFATHGLSLFFVLSGFLLYRPFVAALITDRPAPDIRGYFRNRALRIFPAYIVIFLLVTVVLGTAYTANPAVEGPDAVGRVTNPWMFLADLTLLQTYFPDTLLSGLGVAWSLTAEIAFYVLLPVLFLAAASLLPRRVRPLAAAGLPVALMIVVGWSMNVALWFIRRGLSGQALTEFSWGPTWTAVLDRSVLTQADLFGYGMAVAVVVVWLQNRKLSRTPPAHRIASLLIALLVLGMGFVLSGNIATSVVGIGCAILVLTVVLPGSHDHEANHLARALEWLPFRYLGLISYSIYLWHVPVIWWLKQRGLYDDSTIFGWIGSVAIVAAATIILSTITYYVVERPAMSLKRRTDTTGSRMAPQSAPAAAPWMLRSRSSSSEKGGGRRLRD